MKLTSLKIIIALGLICCTAPAQYVIQIPYLFNNDPYSVGRSVGETYFVVQRPDASYESVRIRGLSESLGGLVRDPYSDQFRNPAYRVGDNPVEFFSDLG